MKTQEALTRSSGLNMIYDADGNLTRRSNANWDQQLQWNSLGQLTAVYTSGAGWVSYGYDGLGRRVRRTAPDGSVTRYVYDGDDLAWEMDGAGTILREYTYYPGVDQPYAVRVGGQGGTEYYYSTDHIGSVRGLVRGDGTLANAYQYGPWGEALSATEAVAQPLRYAARELDPATGLYYVRARWYDPHQGRFVSEDPIGLEGGINLYSYAANSPTNMTDPAGFCPKPGQPGKDTNKDGIIDKDDCFNGGVVVGLAPLRVVGESTRSLMSVIGSVGRVVGSLAGGSGGAAAAPRTAPAPTPNAPSDPNPPVCSWANIGRSAGKGFFAFGIPGAAYGAAIGGVVGYTGAAVAGGTTGALIGLTAGPVTSVVLSVGGAGAGGALGAVGGAALGYGMGFAYSGALGALGGAFGALSECALGIK